MHPIAKEIQSMEDTYLMIEGVPEEQAFEEEMLLHNVIEGILPMETGWRSGVKFHRYCCTGMINLEQYLQGKTISGEQFETLFTGVFALIRKSKEYFLREDGFFISPESLYISQTDGKPKLCYLPEYHKPLIEQMKELSTWFLGRLDVSDTSAVFDGYAFHVLCHKDTCSFDAISAVLEERPAALPVTMWNDEEDEEAKKKVGKRTEQKTGQKKTGFFGKLAVFTGSVAFATGIGMLLLWVLR